MVTTPRRFGRQPCQDGFSVSSGPSASGRGVLRAKMGGACVGAGDCHAQAWGSHTRRKLPVSQ